MIVDTFHATIYVGSRVGRTADTPTFHTLDDAREVCRAYCDEVGLCVSFTATEFIYTNGSEPGCIVGLINYPRFPSTPAQIEAHALRLGELLRQRMEQWRVSVVMPHTTITLGTA